MTQIEALNKVVKYARKFKQGLTLAQLDIEQDKELTDAIYALETGKYTPAQAAQNVAAPVGSDHQAFTE